MNQEASKENRQLGLIDLVSGVIITCLIALAGLLALNWVSITDWLKLLGYNPPGVIVNIASEDTFTPYTRHLFYLNRPELLSSVSSFRTNCPENPSTVVLGCYHSGQNGIFIYNVSDPSLAGVTQVTAAHEVLHAVYARLSDSQRNQLNQELASYYHSGLSDPTVQAEIKIYQQTEPNAVYDEMACTFGTEIVNLPADLNRYYAQYFSNRQAIVNYENKYEAVFKSRQQTIASDDARLSNLKNQVNTNLSDLSERRGTLGSEQAQLNAEAASDPAAYANQAASYNSQVSAYNQEVSLTQGLISSYNQLVDSRNQVAGQLDTLAHAIDTRLTPL